MNCNLGRTVDPSNTKSDWIPNVLDRFWILSNTKSKIDLARRYRANNKMTIRALLSFLIQPKKWSVFLFCFVSLHRNLSTNSQHSLNKFKFELNVISSHCSCLFSCLISVKFQSALAYSNRWLELVVGQRKLHWISSTANHSQGRNERKENEASSWEKKIETLRQFVKR